MMLNITIVPKILLVRVKGNRTFSGDLPLHRNQWNELLVANNSCFLYITTVLSRRGVSQGSYQGVQGL